MTIRLYEKDSYIRDFTAKLVECREEKGRILVRLDKTAFYPEGGGQPCDTGTVGDTRVTEVLEEGGKVWHVLDKVPSHTQELDCSLDWERRFDFMQQHTGQHILSAVLFNEYGAGTIGFHMGAKYVTIDIDKVLEADAVTSAEGLANRMLQRNLEIRVLYPEGGEIDSLKLRKIPEVSEELRVVSIEGLDNNACCGTHTARTGEVVLIKVIKSERYKGGLRLTFACGNRALEDYAMKSRTVSDLAAALSVRETEIVDRVAVIRERLEDLRRENKLLREKMTSLEAEDLYRSAEKTVGGVIVKAVFDNRELGEIKGLASAVAMHPATAILFGVRNAAGCQLLFTRSRDLEALDMLAVAEVPFSMIGARGGGNKVSVQGGGELADKLEAALEYSLNTVRDYLGNV